MVQLELIETNPNDLLHLDKLGVCDTNTVQGRGHGARIDNKVTTLTLIDLESKDNLQSISTLLQ